jgi:hypothetical protein
VQPPNPNHVVAEAVAKLANANIGIKFGPGGLAVVGAIIAFGLLASAAVGWALDKEPWAALIGIALMLGVTTFLAVWSYRFIERNPLTALLSGTQLFKLFQAEQGARDKSVMISSDASPEVGGSQKTLREPGTDGI